jgi:hypothetical protein
MNNIIVAPYPNYKITEECLERDVYQVSAPGRTHLTVSQATPINVPNVAVTTFDDGQSRVTSHGPVVTNEHGSYRSFFPNPVHLYFDAAVTAYRNSSEIATKSFPVCGNKANKFVEGVSFLDADADETHACYNEYFKQRLTAIIMLCTSVEAFINQNIPNSYPDRAKIERYGKFEDKLTKHLPASIHLTRFWEERDLLKTSIMGLYNLRNEVIHLKTHSQEDFAAYYAVVKQLADYDIPKAVDDVAYLMNAIRAGFICETKQQS